MEKKNTILLTVIAIATLLVAVVGATFAYFTATVTPNDEEITTNATTTKLGGTNFTFNSEESKADYLGYPGGLAVFGAKASLTKAAEEEDTDHDYQATFNLKITYTNQTQTDLGWTLYMLSSSDLQDENLQKFKTGVDPECKLNTKAVGVNTYYWYGSKDDESSDYQNGQCTFSEEIRNTFFDKAHTVASGNLKAGQQSKTIDKSTTTLGGDGELESGDSLDNNPLAGRTLDTDTNDEKYYYLVVDYPNESDQSVDAGSEINVTLSVDGDPVSVLKQE